MKLIESNILHTSPLPRIWLHGKEQTYEVPGEELKDAELLALLAQLCLESYDWNEHQFAARVAQLGGHSAETFHAKPGPLWWRLLTFVLLPLNYAIIFCWFVFLIELLVLTAALAVSLIAAYSIQPWFYDIVVYAVIAMVWAFKLAVAVGLLVAFCLAVNPRWASGRGFGFVAEDSTAILILCGSHKKHHLAINAMVWPWYRPRRHAGFVRAWRHISRDVKVWLERVMPKGGDIILTGHSLGAGLAQLAAYELPLAEKSRIKQVICFGSARIGSRKMRELYKQSAKPDLHLNTRHITHDDDAVPRLPPPLFYKHVGRGFELTSSGILVEGTAAPLWESFWEISDDVQSIWSGQKTATQLVAPFGHHQISSQGVLSLNNFGNYSADGARLLKFAQGVSFLRSMSQISAPLVTIVYYLSAAFYYYFRAFQKGFHDHKKELYSAALTLRAQLMREAPAARPRKPGPAPAPWPGGKLIDLNDGAYKKEGMSQSFKRGHFPKWRLDRANPVLTAEQSEEIDIRAKASFLNTGHILAAWARGHDIILERFKGDDYWNWHYAYGGSRDQAIEEIKQLLHLPLDDAASRETDIRPPAAPPLKPTSELPAAG